MKTAICEHCEREFQFKGSAFGRFCSWECYSIYRREHPRRRTRHCKTCGKPFVTIPSCRNTSCSAHAKRPIEISTVGVNKWRHVVRARSYRLVRRGQIPLRPCEVCGTADNITCHHDDYGIGSEFRIRFLCHPHHEELHNALKARGRQLRTEGKYLGRAYRFREDPQVGTDGTENPTQTVPAPERCHETSHAQNIGEALK